jgi:hypothetical protein
MTNTTLGLDRFELVELALKIADIEGYWQDRDRLGSVPNTEIEADGLKYPSLVEEIKANRY